MMRWSQPLVALSICLLASCTSWTVVQQADPNPLRGTKTFAIAPLEFEGFSVSDRQRELLDRGFNYGVRLEGRNDFRFRPVEEAQPRDVVVRTVLHLASGQTASAVEHGDAEVIVRVALVQAGQVLDRIEKRTELGVSGSMIANNSVSGVGKLGWLSDEQQVSARGEDLGDDVADYLQRRAR